MPTKQILTWTIALALIFTIMSCAFADPAQIVSSGYLSGTAMLGSTNIPAVGVNVHAYPVDHSQTGSEGVTDEHGAFTIQNLAAGTYMVGLVDTTGSYARDWVMLPQRETIQVDSKLYPTAVNAPAGKTTNLSLMTNTSDMPIKGTIIDINGKPIPNVTVTLSRNIRDKATIDKSGHFTLNGVTRSKTGINIALPNGLFLMQDITSGQTNNIIHLPKPTDPSNLADVRN